MLAVALIVLVPLLGQVIGGAVRPLFVLGCVGVGIYARRTSPAVHLQTMIILFCFAALVRRLVDVEAGFDEGGLLLAGPLLALLVCLPQVFVVLVTPALLNLRNAAPLVIALCALYAVCLTLGKGDYAQAMGSGLKWLAPLVWAVALANMKIDRDELLDAAVSTLSWVLPVMGLYGIYHHIEPPLWDQYWLLNAPIPSAGLPEPYLLRPFSTMHSPASFATFTAVGIVLVLFFGKSRWVWMLMLPAILALLLSQYRTAWLALIVTLIFCAAKDVTRGRAASHLALAASAVAIFVTLTPFGETLLARLSSFLDPSEDYSGQERLSQFWRFWNARDSYIMGTGFSSGDVMVAGQAGVDGMLAGLWSTMGIVVGLLCLTAVLSIVANAIRVGWRARDPKTAVLGGLAVGWLFQMPLATIIVGELGFLFWMTTVVLMPGERGDG
jgi:hypothetical protein